MDAAIRQLWDLRTYNGDIGHESVSTILFFILIFMDFLSAANEARRGDDVAAHKTPT